MDIYLDTLLHLPYITVDGCREVDGTVFLKLKYLNDTIDCPECGARLERINQTKEVLIRDLPVFGKPVYLQVPHRQFHCLGCQMFRTERLEFVAWRHHHTRRYEQAIYEQVQQSNLEEVSRREGLGVATVRAIFNEYATAAVKKSSICPSG
jgi:transposase